ncbi:hypothetical protein [Sphingorhabdus sp. YGSMI21]|uniref:hypothetical protein n=1 Tax=Sphingorhabdus sp. YGSMI21 TaxID=2077182 RepID=UPI000F4F650F|nr:hypothetical protein [Sphingorhabdus sp. YGSMI21]
MMEAIDFVSVYFLVMVAALMLAFFYSTQGKYELPESYRASIRRSGKTALFGAGGWAFASFLDTGLAIEKWDLNVPFFILLLCSVIILIECSILRHRSRQNSL